MTELYLKLLISPNESHPLEEDWSHVDKDMVERLDPGFVMDALDQIMNVLVTKKGLNQLNEEELDSLAERAEAFRRQIQRVAD